MKSVLISIQPKWCELIANGKKILEVRKTRPNIKTPFKCYIYCTSYNVHECLMLNRSGATLIHSINYKKAIPCGGNIANGKVIGEFVCKSTLPISITYSDPNNKIALREFPYTCLTDKEIMNYLGNGKQGWGSMCDYCEDNSYGRPCIRALNTLLREKNIKIDYEKLSFEDAWDGRF